MAFGNAYPAPCLTLQEPQPAGRVLQRCWCPLGRQVVGREPVNYTGASGSRPARLTADSTNGCLHMTHRGVPVHRREVWTGARAGRAHKLQSSASGCDVCGHWHVSSRKSCCQAWPGRLSEFLEGTTEGAHLGCACIHVAVGSQSQRRMPARAL